MDVLKRFSRSSRLAAVLATSVLLAIACAPAAQPTSAPVPAPKPTESPRPAGASPAAKPITLPRPEQTSINLGHSTVEASSITYPFARDMGLFKKYGIDNVELFYNEGDARALQALIAGQVDASAQSVAVSISTQITDTPVLAVALTVTTLTDDLVAVPEVKSAADLKGKRVAVSSFGGTSHGAVLVGLKALGLTPNDVTIVQVGGESARIAALQARSVQAAPVDIARRDEMTGLGFNVLVSLPDTPLDYGRNGLVARKEWVEKNPNTTLAMVAALLEAQQLLCTETEKAVDSFVRWAQLADRERADRVVKDTLKYMRRDMRWSKEGFELARDVLATQNPAISDVDVTRAYSFQFLDQLEQMGFNEAVGVPEGKRGC